MASPRPESNEAIAERLKLLRLVVSGENQAQFAARLKIQRPRWNNFERGYPLSKEIALLIVRTFPDITLDWLFLGITDGLTVKRLRELEAAAEAQPRSLRA